MLWAKISTAATITVGPILDSAGVEYTGAVIGDLTLRKHDGSSAAMASAATLTHVDNGHYTLVTTTGNMDTIGRLQIRCNKSTYQMPPAEIMVLPAAVYDILITNGDLSSKTNITAGTIASVTGAVGSVTGAVGSVTGNVGGNVIGNVSGNVSGSVGSVAGAVGSVTGAVGSVTGNVGGNVVGSAASVTGAVGSVSGNVGGDVAGKVLGGGAGTISGDGVRAASVTGAVGSVTGLTPATIDTQLSGTHGTGAWGGAGGTGARVITVAVTASAVAVAGAQVRMTSGINTFLLTTDAAGHAVFSLDDGTYTLAVSKSGYSYTPTSQSVSTDATIAAALTAIVIPAATNPLQSNAYIYAYDGHGALEAAVTLTFQLASLPAADLTGLAVQSGSFTAVSDSGGLLTVLLIRGATYRGKRQSGFWVDFTVDDAATYALPVLLGTT